MKSKTIKPLVGILFIFLLTSFVFPGQPQEKGNTIEAAWTVDVCNAPNRAFQDGEEITYKIYYNWNFVWLSAGEVTFRVRELNSQYHFSVKGRTYSSYEWFYKVRDNYDTYVDKTTLLPAVSIRDVNEGKYTLYDKVTFDRKKNIASSFRGKTRDKAQTTDYPVESCMHDILSIIYYLRNVDFNRLSPGSDIPIKIFMDKETWPLKVRYYGKEEQTKIKGHGKCKTIHFGPQVIEGYIFKEDSKMNVWASDDANKVPLLIESPLSVGSVKVILKDYKGLKHNFTGFVD